VARGRSVAPGGSGRSRLFLLVGAVEHNDSKIGHVHPCNFLRRGVVDNRLTIRVRGKEPGQEEPPPSLVDDILAAVKALGEAAEYLSVLLTNLEVGHTEVGGEVLSDEHFDRLSLLAKELIAVELSAALEARRYGLNLRDGEAARVGVDVVDVEVADAQDSGVTLNVGVLRGDQLKRLSHDRRGLDLGVHLLNSYVFQDYQDLLVLARPTRLAGVGRLFTWLLQDGLGLTGEAGQVVQRSFDLELIFLFVGAEELPTVFREAITVGVVLLLVVHSFVFKLLQDHLRTVPIAQSNELVLMLVERLAEDPLDHELLELDALDSSVVSSDRLLHPLQVGGVEVVEALHFIDRCQVIIKQREEVIIVVS